MKYHTSRYLITLSHFSGWKAVYHAFYGFGTILRPEDWALLDRFAAGNPQADGDHGHPEAVTAWSRKGFLVPADCNEERTVLNEFAAPAALPLSILNLQITAACNFSCTNCMHFLSEALPGEKSRQQHMSFATARTALDWYFAHMEKTGQRRLRVNFKGGEPLLNWHVIKRILEYVREAAPPGLDVAFSVNTNASLIDEAIAAWLREFCVELLPSLDGPVEVNDLIRHKAGGGTTYAAIIRGLTLSARAGNPARALHVTLTSDNLDRIDRNFFAFLTEFGIRAVTMEPDLTDRLGCSPDYLSARLLDFYRLGRAREITVTGYWLRPFAKIAAGKKNTAAHFCKALSGENITVMQDGSLTPCAYIEGRAGRLSALVREGGPEAILGGPVFQAYGRRRAGMIDACTGCELEGLCAGGCLAAEQYGAHRQDPGINRYRCEVYRLVTRGLLADTVDTVRAREAAG